MKNSNCLELIKAAHESDIEKTNQLLSLSDEEIDVNFVSKNDNWMTALIIASFKNNEKIVFTLLNDDRTQINTSDFEGKTAIVWAANLGRKNIVNLIISAAAKHQKNNGFDWQELLKTQLIRKEIQEQINFKNAVLLAIVTDQEQENLKNSILTNFNSRNISNQVPQESVNKLKELKDLLIEKFEDFLPQIAVANENNQQNQLSSKAAAISVISFYVDHQENFQNFSQLSSQLSSQLPFGIINPIFQTNTSSPSVISQIIDFSQLSYEQKITALEVMNEFFGNNRSKKARSSSARSARFLRGMAFSCDKSPNCQNA